MAKTVVDCPCGEMIQGETEDDLVTKVQELLKANYSGHEYTREQIV